jgi:succinoglycan biosynthesis transport protein ExoP
MIQRFLFTNLPRLSNKAESETPQVEREYLALARDHESTAAKYKEVKQNLMNARLGENLERSSRGERFSVIEPAKLP